ncbi:MAG: hypothetical protein RR400_03955 [Clostridia bacterium]
MKTGFASLRGEDMLEIQKCRNDKDVCSVMESVALQECALSHILNAEGEKIQNAVAKDVSIKDLLCINDSVANTIQEVTSLEIVLLNKLKAVTCHPCPPKPVPPIPPVRYAYFCVYAFNSENCHPLKNAIIKIFKASALVCEGETSCRGIFRSKPLEIGKYLIKISYLDKPEKSVEMELVCPCCCHKISAGFKVVMPKQVYFEGCVFDECRRPISCANVCFKGASDETVKTNRCGYFCVRGLTALNNFKISVQCAGCETFEKTFEKPFRPCYRMGILLFSKCGD